MWVPWINKLYVSLNHATIYMADQIILTCQMPSDTPNSITGHTDQLLSGEMSTHDN